MLIGGRAIRSPGGVYHPELGARRAERADGPRPASFSFWAEQDVIAQILGEGDSWALSKAPAFVTRELPPAWKYDSAA